MNNEQQKDFKDTRWVSTKQLHANLGLKSTEYVTPILWNVFLKFVAFGELV